MITVKPACPTYIEIPNSYSLLIYTIIIQTHPSFIIERYKSSLRRQRENCTVVQFLVSSKEFIIEIKL